jgi:Domain of unknown function (DUF4136)
MNSRRVCLVLLLVLIGVWTAWAQEVKVGYDKSSDFNQFKTYAWMPRDIPPTMPLLATKIQLEVDYELSQKGLRKVDSDPDLLVTYQGGLDAQGAAGAHDPRYSTTGGIPPPDATVWGGSLSASSVQQVLKGTLAISLVNPRQKQTVWSGTVKTKLDYENQQKLFDQVGKAVAAIFKKYPPPEKSPRER